MSNIFFNDQDDFKLIIGNHLSQIDNVSQVQTGWTNYVFRVTTPSGKFYFRFPRNEFFAKALVKEYNMIQFVKNKITFETPNLQLFYNDERPYTIHKEVEGESLSECYNSLSRSEKLELAKDTCKLLGEFSQIDIEKYSAFNFQKVSNFLDNLSLVSQNNYDLGVHTKLKNLEDQHLVFSHGDFNPGNLILKDHKLVAIIDFSFAGISNDITDLTRLIGRCPEDFAPMIIEEYEKQFQTKADAESMGELNKIWHYVEEKYILYIKQNHPSIILPTLV